MSACCGRAVDLVSSTHHAPPRERWSALPDPKFDAARSPYCIPRIPLRSLIRRTHTCAATVRRHAQRSSALTVRLELVSVQSSRSLAPLISETNRPQPLDQAKRHAVALSPFGNSKSPGCPCWPNFKFSVMSGNQSAGTREFTFFQKGSDALSSCRN